MNIEFVDLFLANFIQDTPALGNAQAIDMMMDLCTFGPLGPDMCTAPAADPTGRLFALPDGVSHLLGTVRPRHKGSNDFHLPAHCVLPLFGKLLPNKLLLPEL